jgi:hypothetical protein
VTPRFSDQTREALRSQGWRLASLPADLSLESLRLAGAPFKSDRFFRDHAPGAVEVPSAPGDLAYRPGLMLNSPGRPFADSIALLATLVPLLPDGTRPVLGPAAAYVWLLADHHQRTSEWLLSRCFTFTIDHHTPTRSPLVVGAFGGARPLIVTPLPEHTGRGVGLLPLIVPG